MWKKIYILIWLLLLVEYASAELMIDPNPMSVALTANEPKSFQVLMTNTFDFKILDFKFVNLTGFNFPAIELEPNTSKQIVFNISRSDVGAYLLPSKVSFKYIVEIPENPTTYYVNITNTGFKPNFLVVRQGDTVIWTNLDQITHTVTSGTFDEPIQPNASFSKTLQDINIINYMDTILFWGGTIQVVGATSEEKVNNPNFNKEWVINLEVTLNPTSLSISNDKTNYTISPIGSEEGLLEIKNIGEILAQKITLKSSPDWIIFDENSFDIGAGVTNYVTYTIEPIITATDHTNKTYMLNISIKGSNTEEYLQQIKLFVPYTSVFSDENSDEGFLSLYERFCRQNPSFLICNNTISKGGGTEIIIRDPSIPINLTSSQVLDMLTRIQRIEDSNSRTNNEIKKTTELLQEYMPQQLNLINESINIGKENQKKEEDASRAYSIILFIFVIIACIVALGLAIRKFTHKKSLIDGGIKHR